MIDNKLIRSAQAQPASVNSTHAQEAHKVSTQKSKTASETQFPH